MSTVADHYAKFLSPIYLWMVGGFDAALDHGAAEVAALCDPDPQGKIAIDLGAGFGPHSIPLARRGYAVTAIDTSAFLLSQFRERSAGLPVRTVEADLLEFPKYIEGPADLILCMGDTLTHLPDQAVIANLFDKVAQSLKPGGRLLLTFRDYSNPPTGHARFIPVRSDSDRLLHCFLEATPTHIQVHDVLHERNGSTWQMQVSSYMKLRISPEWVVRSLEMRGLSVRTEATSRGMVRLVATGA